MSMLVPRGTSCGTDGNSLKKSSPITVLGDADVFDAQDTGRWGVDGSWREDDEEGCSKVFDSGPLGSVFSGGMFNFDCDRLCSECERAGGTMTVGSSGDGGTLLVDIFGALGVDSLRLMLIFENLPPFKELKVPRSTDRTFVSVYEE